MYVLVHYTQFHSDNYQGGSGKTVEYKKIVEISPDTKVGDVKYRINEVMREALKECAPFDSYDICYSIKGMELFFEDESKVIVEDSKSEGQSVTESEDDFPF